jgi:hypothetical protein
LIVLAAVLGLLAACSAGPGSGPPTAPLVGARSGAPAADPPTASGTPPPTLPAAATPTPTAATTSTKPAGSGVWRPFRADSPWNTRIGANPVLDPQSAALIDDLEVSSQWPFFGINISGFSVPVFYATAGTPAVRVAAELGGQGFPGINGMNGSAMVPIPAGAAPDPQSDRHMVVVSADRRLSWDFFGAQHSGSGWSCTLCATTDLTGSGVRPKKQGNPTWFTSHGARACGFPLLAGLIRPEEIKAGRIEHALVIAYPHIRAGLYTPPASTAQARIGDEAVKTRGIPCGGRVQLDPSINIDTLDLSRSGKIVARALQEYGAFVGDYSGAISLYADNSPSARAQWSAGLLDTYALRYALSLGRLRVLKLGTLYDDGNG